MTRNPDGSYTVTNEEANALWAATSFYLEFYRPEEDDSPHIKKADEETRGHLEPIEDTWSMDLKAP